MPQQFIGQCTNKCIAKYFQRLANILGQSDSFYPSQVPQLFILANKISFPNHIFVPNIVCYTLNKGMTVMPANLIRAQGEWRLKCKIYLLVCLHIKRSHINMLFFDILKHCQTEIFLNNILVGRESAWIIYYISITLDGRNDK